MRSQTRSASVAKREDACSITLIGRAKSLEAQRLVEALVDEVVLLHRSTLGHSKRAGSATLTKLHVALEALLADLTNLRRSTASSGAPLTGAHGMSKGDFPSKRLGFGYDIFRLVVDALENEGLLAREIGYPRWEAARCEKVGVATCFNLTDKMIELVESYGVLLNEWRRHWTLQAPDWPSMDGPWVELRAKRKTIGGEKQPAEHMAVDYSSPKARSIDQQMQRINAFLKDQKIDGVSFTGLRRIFNNGDQADFDWDKGGRFYSAGQGEPYELWPSNQRESLLSFDGEEVTEVDLRASHLTLLHALSGTPFDPEEDPYQLADWPRIIVKLWVAQAIGSSNPRPFQWSRKSQTDYEKERRGSDLQVDFPIREVGASVKNKHPLLIDLKHLGLKTLDLQYHEAEILRRAMEKLMFELGIPALPIHDALIVPQSFAGAAGDCLKLAFRGYVEDVTGERCIVVPNVTSKGS